MDTLERNIGNSKVQNVSISSPFFNNDGLVDQIKKLYKLNIITQEKDKLLFELLFKGQFQYKLSPFCSLHAFDMLYGAKNIYDIPIIVNHIFFEFISSEFYSETNMNCFLSVIESYKLIPELYYEIALILHFNFIIKQQDCFQNDKQKVFLEKIDIPDLIIFLSNILSTDIFNNFKYILIQFYKKHILNIYKSTCIRINQVNLPENQNCLFLHLELLDMLHTKYYYAMQQENTHYYNFMDKKIMTLMLRYVCLLCNASFTFVDDLKKVVEETNFDTLIKIANHFIKKNYSLKGLLLLQTVKLIIEKKDMLKNIILLNINFTKLKSYRSNWTVYDEAVLFSVKLFSYKLSPTLINHTVSSGFNRLNEIKRLIKNVLAENKEINIAAYANKADDHDFIANKIFIMKEKKRKTWKH